VDAEGSPRSILCPRPTPRRAVTRAAIAWATIRVLLPICQHNCPSTTNRDAISVRSRVRSLQLHLLPPLLTRSRKHWQQLDDFHSLTDLKIHVSSHKEPQITAGLRSVCWKVHLPPLRLEPKLIGNRYSSSSRLSTGRHGQPISPTLATPTSRSAHTTSEQYAILTSSNRPWIR
jgi:hypothetical protein